MITVFSKEWFKKYNRQLCWLANSFIGDWLFKFTKYGHDLVSYGKITGIHPNAITHKRRLLYNFETRKTEQEYTTQFFGRNEYALRLQKVFYPIWLLFHAWDMLIANPFKPAWNLGFDTLTQYPDGSTTGDAILNRVGDDADSFATIRAGAGTVALNDLTTHYLSIYHDATITEMRRIVAVFDTSALTSGATITSSVLSAYGTAKYEGLGTPALHCCKFNGTTDITFAASDYNIANWINTSLGNIAYASYSTSAYNNITLNDDTVISKTGMTRLGWRLHWDMLNNSSGLSLAGVNQSSFDFNASGNASNKPKLVVTYTTVDTGNMFLMFN